MGRVVVPVLIILIAEVLHCAATSRIVPDLPGPVPFTSSNWTFFANTPGNFAYAAPLAYNGSVMGVGGCRDVNCSILRDETFVFDFSSNSSLDSSRLLGGPVAGRHAAVSLQGAIYVFRACSLLPNSTNTSDPTIQLRYQRFERVAGQDPGYVHVLRDNNQNLMPPRANATCVSFGTKYVFIVGGVVFDCKKNLTTNGTDCGLKMTNDILVWSASSMTVVATTFNYSKPAIHVSAVSDSSAIYLLGGYDEQNRVLDGMTMLSFTSLDEDLPCPKHFGLTLPDPLRQRLVDDTTTAAPLFVYANVIVIMDHVGQNIYAHDVFTENKDWVPSQHNAFMVDPSPFMDNGTLVTPLNRGVGIVGLPIPDAFRDIASSIPNEKPGISNFTFFRFGGFANRTENRSVPVTPTPPATESPPTTEMPTEAPPTTEVPTTIPPPPPPTTPTNAPLTPTPNSSNFWLHGSDASAAEHLTSFRRFIENDADSDDSEWVVTQSVGFDPRVHESQSSLFLPDIVWQNGTKQLTFQANELFTVRLQNEDLFNRCTKQGRNVCSFGFSRSLGCTSVVEESKTTWDTQGAINVSFDDSYNSLFFCFTFGLPNQQCQGYPLNRAWYVLDLFEQVTITPGGPTSAPNAPPPADSDSQLIIVLSIAVVVVLLVVLVAVAVVRRRAGSASASGESLMSEGRYDHISVIGRGSFGRVIKVRRKADNQILAMKYLEIPNAKDMHEALHEFDILRSLQDHMNIIRMHDMFMNYELAPSPSNYNGGSSSLSGNSSNSRRDGGGITADMDPLLAENGMRSSSSDRPKRNICFVMDYHRGGDLKQWALRYGGAVPEPILCHIAVQIISMLEFIHHRKVIHRDLKPENILIATNPTELTASAVNERGPQPGGMNAIADSLDAAADPDGGRDPHRSRRPDRFRHLQPIVVTDFGLAKVVEPGIETSFAGTAVYSAPECMATLEYLKRAHREGVERAGKAPPTPAAPCDMWSLGCVLYGVATKRLEENNVRFLYRDVLEPSFAEMIREDVETKRGYSPQFVALLLRLLRHKPEERPTAKNALKWFRRSPKEHSYHVAQRLRPPSGATITDPNLPSATATKSESQLTPPPSGRGEPVVRRRRGRHGSDESMQERRNRGGGAEDDDEEEDEDQEEEQSTSPPSQNHRNNNSKRDKSNVVVDDDDD